MAPLSARDRSPRRAPRRARRVPTLLLALVAACSDAVAPADPLTSPESLNLGALQVRAATQVVGAPVPGGPAMLRTVVTLTNQGAWPLALQHPACPLHVTGHRLAARDGAPGFVFPAAPPFADRGACTASLVGVTIAPGATHEIVAAVDLAALRAAVPAGRWFLLAELRLDASSGAPALVRAGDVTL